MHDTDTSTPIETDTEIPTFDFAILFWGGWSVGNSYAEALDNAMKFGLGGRRKPHLLVAFSVPVQNVRASMWGLEWQWSEMDGGKAIEIPMNGYGEES